MTTVISHLYDELNHRYWRGRLPKYAIRRLSARRIGSHGRCDYDTQRIYLAFELTGEKLRAVLLHEMIHIRCANENHGPQFRRQLRRLIRHGEQELARHLSQYIAYPDAGPARLTRKAFMMELSEMRGEIRYWTQDNPRRRWPALLRALRSLFEWPCWQRLWLRFVAKGSLRREPLSIYAWLRAEWVQARTGSSTGTEITRAVLAKALKVSVGELVA
jgi:hypothetical protein